MSKLNSSIIEIHTVFMCGWCAAADHAILRIKFMLVSFVLSNIETVAITIYGQTASRQVLGR